MKKIVAFFKNPIVISLIGLLLLSLLIWFGGPYIKFGENNTAPLGSTTARLLAIIIIVVIWGLNNLRIQLSNRKHNQELVDDLQENQQSQAADLTSEQTSEELHQINERFAQALATLKKLKFRGRGSKKALYELPWYIIIGPPGSGKTTALVNSSLDFPLAEQFGKAALQGVGGTRNCDWWFTNEAVLIDTAGRYTTQDSHKVVDSTAWEGFLNLLKKNRRRRPINGAIIAISLQDLLSQTEEERIMHARTIRSRIDELMEKLEIRFPIYLMFTKSDLVAGFSEFFEDLGKEEREQVWGISLPNAPKESQSPDFDYLSEEYRKLLDRLYQRVLWRVHSERDVKRRGAIQGFPQQMENLQSIVDSFVRQTFVKNRYRFQPYLRGVYFSSGTQDGTPIDRMMTAVSANFGFNREVAQLPHQQGKSFFLGQLFRGVIFPESELVGANKRYETFIRWAQRVGYASLAIVVVSLILVWAGSVTRNKMYMSEVESYIAEFKAEDKRRNKRSADLRTVLPPLNALARASIVYDQEEHPWLSGLGLYDPNVDKAADAAYAAKLKQLLIPRLLHHLETTLKQGHAGGDLYNTFRVYLMFQKTDHRDRDLITEWFTESWSRKFHGQATRRQELEAHLKALLDLDPPPVKLNRNVVKATRATLLRVPVSRRIYSRIRNNPEYSRKVNILDEYGETVRNAFQITPAVAEKLKIPYMFTIDGYENIDLSPDSPVIEDILNDRWVLTDDESQKVDFIHDDLDEISKQVKEHYLAEYTRYWLDIYNSLKIAPFTSLRQANDVLASFTDPVYSPLLAILQVGVTNTQLTNQTLANVADDNKGNVLGRASGSLAGHFDGTRVDRQFRSLNQLMRESSKRPAPINTVMQKIQQMQEYMNEISISPDPARKAFTIARARYQSGAGNPITALRAYAKKVPKPVKAWLVSLADQSWKVVLQSAHQFVSAEWRTRIHQPYQAALAGRYPLDRSSSDELAVFDFSEFFKPGGTMDLFFTEYIKPFISTRHGWQNRSVDGYSLGLSRKAIAQIRKAQRIKQILFRNNPAVPGLTFQLRPYAMDKNDARFTLEVGNDRISYSHGPKFWKTLHWAGDDENSRVRIYFEDLKGQQHSRSYDGPWAWFRLQDDSPIKKTSKSNVYLVTYRIREINYAGDGTPGNARDNIDHSIVFQIKAKSVNNPFGKNLLGSFRVPERI